MQVWMELHSVTVIYYSQQKLNSLENWIRLHEYNGPGNETRLMYYRTTNLPYKTFLF